MDVRKRSNFPEEQSDEDYDRWHRYLAKQSYSVHGVDAHGRSILRKTLNRAKLLELIALWTSVRQFARRLGVP